MVLAVSMDMLLARKIVWEVMSNVVILKSIIVSVHGFDSGIVNGNVIDSEGVIIENFGLVNVGSSD